MPVLVQLLNHETQFNSGPAVSTYRILLWVIADPAIYPSIFYFASLEAKSIQENGR